MHHNAKNKHSTAVSAMTRPSTFKVTPSDGLPLPVAFPPDELIPVPVAASTEVPVPILAVCGANGLLFDVGFAALMDAAVL